MPRKTRSPGSPGGSGAQGQRTDLQASSGASPVQKPAAPTGMAYGAHADSVEAQRAMPLPAAPPPGQGAGPVTAGAPPGGGAGGFADAMVAALNAHGPDGSVGLTGPSLNPTEPVQAGLSIGPGPGPAGLTPDTPRAANLLQQMAVSSGNPEMAELAEMARRMSA